MGLSFTNLPNPTTCSPKTSTTTTRAHLRLKSSPLTWFLSKTRSRRAISIIWTDQPIDRMTIKLHPATIPWCHRILTLWRRQSEIRMRSWSQTRVVGSRAILITSIRPMRSLNGADNTLLNNSNCSTSSTQISSPWLSYHLQINRSSNRNCHLNSLSKRTPWVISIFPSRCLLSIKKRVVYGQRLIAQGQTKVP